MPCTAARPAGFQNADSTPSQSETYAPPSAEARAPAGTSRNAKPGGSAAAWEGANVSANSAKERIERRGIRFMMEWARPRETPRARPLYQDDAGSATLAPGAAARAVAALRIGTSFLFVAPLLARRIRPRDLAPRFAVTTRATLRTEIAEVASHRDPSLFGGHALQPVAAHRDPSLLRVCGFDSVPSLGAWALVGSQHP